MSFLCLSSKIVNLTLMLFAGNIFITRQENRYSNSLSSCDEEFEDDEFEEESVVYKIGKLELLFNIVTNFK